MNDIIITFWYVESDQKHDVRNDKATHNDSDLDQGITKRMYFDKSMEGYRMPIHRETYYEKICETSEVFQDTMIV